MSAEARNINTSVGGKRQPFPWKQMAILGISGAMLIFLAIVRLCEPIAFYSIQPYVYFMVRDFHSSADPTDVAFHAGLVMSAFVLGEFATALHWGRLSDKLGRKPVLLAGLAGTASSMLLFAFSPNLATALTARAIGGLLNGNIGVIQTTVAELAPLEQHRARAFSILPIVSSVGSSLGAAMGGALANPCNRFPAVFPRGSVWEHHPYWLPGIASASIVLLCLGFGYFFLEETNSAWQSQRDREPSTEGVLSAGGKDTPLSEAAKPTSSLTNYGTCDSRPVDSCRLRNGNSRQNKIQGVGEPTVFTRQVLCSVLGYGLLAFHTMTFDALLPTFLASDVPSSPGKANLSFRFVGGFGMNSQQIGMIMAAQGLVLLCMNLHVVPITVQRFGAFRTFRFLARWYCPLYLVTPYLVLLPGWSSKAGLGFVIVWKCTFMSLAYTSINMLLAHSAPSPHALGTINGAAGSTASFFRALASAASGWLYTAGLKYGYSGLAWWGGAVVALAGACLAIYTPDQRVRKQDVESRADMPDAR